MPTTQVNSIVECIQDVLEAAPFAFVSSHDPFALDSVPNATVESRYRVIFDGVIEDQTVGNDRYVRLDRVLVQVAKKLNLTSGHDSLQTLADTLDDAARYIIDDGPDNSYHARVIDSSITRSEKNADVALGTLTFAVDYDWDGRTSAA